MQLTRNLDGPGQLTSGTFDYQFNFKNVDLDIDSYAGINLDVRFEVVAEMVYEGSVMNYTVNDSRIFQVRNSKQQLAAVATGNNSEENKDEAVVEKEMVTAPKLKIDFHGFRASEKPCVVEVYLHNTHLHIDRD